MPVNATLPILPIEREVTPRGAAEVAGRTLALLTVAVKSEGLEQPVVDRLVRDYGLAPDLSPEERAFIANPAPTAADRAKFNWRYEGAWALLWALSYVPSLGKPTQQCDAATAVRAMRDHHQRAGFIADARLRPMSEILDQADRIYRYDWAAVDARANGRPAPAGLDEEITVERHKAFNWLIGYEGAAWDDVTTDT
ncbi:MAG: DUF4272 domain-containing protein [Proteobacteria bacterium]|nr:DUF4272 domain-containing protein [Pseudomonadota bacterium]